MSSSNRSARRIFRRVLGPAIGARGATTVEYAVILVAVLLLAAGSWKLLGSALGKRSNVAGDTVSGGESSSSSGGGGGGGGGGKGSGAGRGGGGSGSGSSSGGGDKATAAAKVSVGGVGGAAGESGGGSSSGKPSRESGSSAESGGSGGGGPIGSVGGRDGGGGDVTEGFTAKRWFGIGLLAAGVFALGYVLMSMRRAKKNADDMAKGDKGKKGFAAPRGPAPPLA